MEVVPGRFSEASWKTRGLIAAPAGCTCSNAVLECYIVDSLLVVGAICVVVEELMPVPVAFTYLHRGAALPCTLSHGVLNITGMLQIS